MTIHHRGRRLAPLAIATSLSLLAAPLVALPAAAASDHLLISEVYGGGGNSGAPYAHDFIELYNPTGSAIDLAGYSLEYLSASGNSGGSCALSGSIAPSGYLLTQQATGTNTAAAALPTPDVTCKLALSGTSGSVVLKNAAGTVDLVGYGTASRFEGAPTKALSNTTSAARATGVDTDVNASDFTVGAPEPQNSGAAPGGSPSPKPTPTPTPTTPELTAIAAIQGTGAASPLVGQTVSTVGVVTAAYPTGGFNGVYLQTPGTGGAAKAPGDASDGVFWYSTWAAENLTPGQCVQVVGTKVVEFNGMTELTGGTGQTLADCAAVRPTELAGLPATDAEKEPYEGMLVLPQGPYTVTNNYQLNQFGQVGLAVGTEPLYQATDVVEPGPAAEAYEAENVKKYITLDDGSSWDYLRNAAAQDSPLPYLSAQEPMRAASQVTFTKPVILDYRFQWNFQPTGQIVGATDADDPVASENDREFAAPKVGGGAQLASFNVLNYFSDLGEQEDVYQNCPSYTDRDGVPVTTNRCEVRGAWTAEAFADQKAKIVSAINGTGAEAVALMEVENSAGITWISHDRDWSLADLVAALNADARERGLTGVKWAYAASPVVSPTTEDVIRVAFIYNPDVLDALGASMIDLDPAFANARYPLAQKFKVKNTGKPFVMVANHFKSKGSGADDGTGQGLSNPAREEQARALVAWVQEQFGNQAAFLLGDFNAYSKETPVQIIEDAGYTEVVKKYEPRSHTYQFNGRLGSLDHVFANPKAMKLVTGGAVWDINADESAAFQYSRRNYNVVDFYAPDPFASSDHDADLVGIRTR